jgi:hypothetical protein
MEHTNIGNHIEDKPTEKAFRKQIDSIQTDESKALACTYTSWMEKAW